jgi:hypothetical protein
MKYWNEVIINLPLDRVIELFDSEENLFKWQPELISFEHISGEKGEVGAKSLLKYKMGKREVEMTETITVKDLPREFSGTYEAKGVWNEVKNYFEVIDESTTKWHSDCQFKFSGFMRVIAFFMPGTFIKQSQKFLDQFKTFAEGD